MCETSVPISELLKLVENLLKFPYPQICRHLVVCDIISLLEKHIEIPSEFAKAVVRCDDEIALKDLEQFVKDYNEGIEKDHQQEG